MFREGVIKPLLNYLFLIHLLPHVSHPQSSHALNTSVPPMVGRIMKIGVTLTPHLSVAPFCHLKKAAQPLSSLHTTPQKILIWNLKPTRTKHSQEKHVLSTQGCLTSIMNQVYPVVCIRFCNLIGIIWKRIRVQPFVYGAYYHVV